MPSGESGDEDVKSESPGNELPARNIQHVPVLLQEAIDLLAPGPGGVFVDGTIGAGGHAAEILRRSAPDGMLIGLDQDAEAIERCRSLLAPFGKRVVLRQANYRELPDVLNELGVDAVNGVLLDLGVSWFHLRSPERGFSFMLDGPLDMRMDLSGSRTAADLVNELPRAELARILREYGEESRAGAIARAIEQARARGPITTTAQLARIVASVFPPYPPRRTHPATLTFQALRIAVNEELDALQAGLNNIIPLLRTGGRVAVISFHSLEDRIVKQTFVAAARNCICPPRMPVCSCTKRSELKVLTSRPVKAGAEELQRNPASRSAKLRAAQKL